jgi:hypothetical protein
MFSEIKRKARASTTGACAAGAITLALLMPLAGRPSGWAIGPRSRNELSSAAGSAGSPWKERPIVVSRDPFLAPVKHVAFSQPLQVRSVDPPLVVRAIVVGENSRALVEAGGATRLIGVGDRVGSLRVMAIRIDRIQLSDGSTALLDNTLP